MEKKVVPTGQKSNKGINRQQKTKSDINLHKPEFVDPEKRKSNKNIKRNKITNLDNNLHKQEFATITPQMTSLTIDFFKRLYDKFSNKSVHYLND